MPGWRFDVLFLALVVAPILLVWAGWEWRGRWERAADLRHVDRLARRNGPPRVLP